VKKNASKIPSTSIDYFSKLVTFLVTKWFHFSLKKIGVNKWIDLILGATTLAFSKEL